MKKFFIFAAAAVVAMAACSKNELNLDSVPNKKIGFEVANYPGQTRANVALTNAEDGIYEFHTYAYQFPKQGDAVEFMNTDIFAWDNAATPQKVTSGTGIYMWAPENDYYWPKTGYINFYSYAGTQAPAESVSADKKTVTLTYANKTIASTDNFMVADAALRFNSNQETYAVDGTEGSGHVTTGVPTLFRHLLAKLYVDVKIQIPAAKVSANTIWKVQVLDGFDFDGDSSIADGEKSLIIPVNKGTLTLTNADALAADAALNTTTQQWTRKADYTTEGTPDTDVVSGWKPGDTNENVQLSQATVLTLPVSATESTAIEQLLDWRTVMPQLTDNVALQLVYKVQALHGDTVFMEEIRTVGVVLNGDSAADIHDLTGSLAQWESNKKITYHIIIDPVSEKVTFDPAVEAYDAVEANADDVININNNGIVTP
ncbi:MAG: hypothetical protein IJV01_02785 [Bacteroidales bacterium]|nr:hypothetical protein [Bacteroidales bacterium]